MLGMTKEGAERLRTFLAKGDFTSKELGSTLRSWRDRGIPRKPQPESFRRVDRLMKTKWREGSARQVFEGNEPTLVELPQVDPALDVLTDAIEATADALTHQALELRQVARDLRGKQQRPNQDH